MTLVPTLEAVRVRVRVPEPRAATDAPSCGEDRLALAWWAPAAFAAGYVVSAALGWTTVADPSQIALFWPAAGIAAVWVLTARSLLGVLACVALTGGVMTGIAATTFPLPLAMLGGAGHALVPLTVRAVYAQRQRQRLGDAPEISLGAPRDLGELALAALVAGVVSPLVSGSAAAVQGTWQWEPFLGWLVGTTVAVLVVGGALLAALTTLTEWSRRRRGAPGSGADLPLGWPLTHEDRPAARLEAAALAASTIAALAVVFGPGPTVPLSFSLFPMLVWAGYRFTPLVASLHGLLLTAGVLLATELGWGPLVSVTDPWALAITVQLLAGVGSGVAMLLSLGVAERRRLEQRIAWDLAREAAAEQQRTQRELMAREVGDTILQGIVTAEIALDLGRDEQAREVLRRTSAHARDWIGQQVQDPGLAAGAAVRTAPASAALPDPRRGGPVP